MPRSLTWASLVAGGPAADRFGGTDRGAAVAVYEAGPAFGSYVVVDRNLITGQNPQSAEAAAEALLTALAGA